MRPLLLDLFCGAGGASMGYHRAGFDCIGVDIKPQPHYPFEFHQGDALDYFKKHGHKYDVIHASPPCQAFTAMNRMWNKKEHPDLLTPTRKILLTLRKPYIIENVPGAPLILPILLCGSMFNLGTETHQLRRHRYFETNILFPLYPICRHRKQVIGIYGDHARCRRRKIKKHEKGVDFPDKDKVRLASTAMGIDWMNWRELTQAVPPAYTEWLGKKILAEIHLPPHYRCSRHDGEL